MRRVMLFVVLAVGLSTAALAEPIIINFRVVSSTGSVASFTGPNLGSATAFNFGTPPFLADHVAPNDQSGLANGDTVELSPTEIKFGAGTSGAIDLTKEWTTAAGDFTETFTSFTATRVIPNSLTLELDGTLVGPDGIMGPVEGFLNASQPGGAGNEVFWTLTEHTETPVIPEPGTLGLLGTGLVSLAGLAKRKLKLPA